MEIRQGDSLVFEKTVYGGTEDCKVEWNVL